MEHQDGTWIEDANGILIARVYFGGVGAPDWEARLHADAELLASAPEQARENARLRAQNAELLAACREVLPLLGIESGAAEDLDAAMDDARDRLRAASAAAEKEESATHP